jgi:hypothetical protein
MWEFYLRICEMSFRYRSLVVFQMQIGKQMDSVPITRDYIYRDDAPALAPESPLAVEEPVAATRRRATATGAEPARTSAKRPARRSSKSTSADTRH